MSRQVPKCVKEFNCLDCDDRKECKDWLIILKDERARSEELMDQMPELVKFFGFCAFKTGNKDDWKEKLEELAFGC